MRPLPLAITVFLSVWALSVSPAAEDVLLTVSLMSAGLILLRWMVQEIWMMLACGLSPARVGAQLSIARAFDHRGRNRAIRDIFEAYGLTPELVTEMSPDDREEELHRLTFFLRDHLSTSSVLPTGLTAPDRAELRREIANFAGEAAPSYAAIFDAAILALETESGDAALSEAAAA